MPGFKEFGNKVDLIVKTDKTKTFQEKLNSPKLLIDVHTHFFNSRDVPSNFISKRFKMSSATIKILNEVAHKDVILKKLIPKKYLRLLDNISKTPSELVDKLTNAYSGHDVIYTPLLMDMRGMKGGQSNTYADQIAEIDHLCQLHPDTLLPFLAIDPTSHDFEENFENLFAVSNRKYHGIKLYPSLGYLPSHPNLMRMYELCEDKQIPITTHCSSALVRLPVKNVKVVGLDRNCKKINKTVCLESRYEYKHYFNAPNRWIPVLKTFPKLKLNIAHFGGDKAWTEYNKGKNGTKDGKWINSINAMIGNYDNVYTDFSYTMYSRSATALLIEAMIKGFTDETKVLYGSDFYLLESEDEMKKIFEGFKRDLGGATFKKMSQTNNINFLFH